jgi:cell division protein FtsB
VVSLLFWMLLLTAAMLFAAVSLAPKLVTVRSLSLQHHHQQLRLLHLEQQTEQLERVVLALEQDPQFSAEIARLEFDAQRPGEELLPVDDRLQLSPVGQTVWKPVPAALAEDPWLLSLLKLHDTAPPRPATRAEPKGPGTLGVVFSRYKKPRD